MTATLTGHVAWAQEIQRLMTRYCSDRQARVNKSVEQEVIRQRDVAELKTNVLKNKLVNAKQANEVVCHAANVLPFVAIQIVSTCMMIPT